MSCCILIALRFGEIHMLAVTLEDIKKSENTKILSNSVTQQTGISQTVGKCDVMMEE